MIERNRRPMTHLLGDGKGDMYMSADRRNFLKCFDDNDANASIRPCVRPGWEF